MRKTWSAVPEKSAFDQGSRIWDRVNYPEAFARVAERVLFWVLGISRIGFIWEHWEKPWGDS